MIVLLTKFGIEKPQKNRFKKKKKKNRERNTLKKKKK